MSEQYNEYLYNHVNGVIEAYQWLEDNLPEFFNFVRVPWDPYWSITMHDDSKFGSAEYEAYDEYFYPGAEGRSYRVKEEFNKAWLHHIHHNPHHWQYWVLMEDDPSGNGGVGGAGKNYIPIEMPGQYMMEMIADWWSFSWKKGDPTEIFKWYKDHKKTMILHENTRRQVEEILDRMEKKLAEKELEASGLTVEEMPTEDVEDIVNRVKNKLD